GQSQWNLEDRFTGWVDVDLTELGEREAVRGGELLAEQGVLPDVVHTSLQVRAIHTAELALSACDRSWIPVHRSWRLNERHYGALQGQNKKETAEKWGEEKLQQWRRSYDVPPPPLEVDDSIDARYATLPVDLIPKSECLADVVDRMLPYWYDGIVPDLAAGRAVLVAAHGNSLRALAMHLEGLSREAVIELNIPTGQPRVYELDGRMRVVSWRYLDPEGAEAAAAAVSKQAG
ncbi:MAG: 2,3-diphosphoglycerate-dependent phosphoglycerate mutase, partial [Acidimicrobiia bacterium]